MLCYHFLPVTICFRSNSNKAVRIMSNNLFSNALWVGRPQIMSPSIMQLLSLVFVVMLRALLEKMSPRIATDYIINLMGYLLLLATLNAMKPHS